MRTYKFEVYIRRISRIYQLNENGYTYWTKKYIIYPTEGYWSDNLEDVLLFLKNLEIQYEDINCMTLGLIDEKYLREHGSNPVVFANVLHKGELLKFKKYPNGNRKYPDYTACGYKISIPSKRRKRKKWTYRNPKHIIINKKDRNAYKIIAKDIIKEDLRVSNKIINKWNRQSKLELLPCHEFRSKPVRSWKSQKIKRQWQKNK